MRVGLGDVAIQPASMARVGNLEDRVIDNRGMCFVMPLENPSVPSCAIEVLVDNVGSQENVLVLERLKPTLNCARSAADYVFPGRAL